MNWTLDSCDLLSKCIFDLLTTPFCTLTSISLCCDLLSKCIFDLLTTPLINSPVSSSTLWFAFKMYLWFTDNTLNTIIDKISDVVICFQNVSLIYWQHQRVSIIDELESCDLLSKCIFDLLTTPVLLVGSSAISLWFAFKMYLWFTDNTFERLNQFLKMVVICFQNVSLIYWQHQ